MSKALGTALARRAEVALKLEHRDPCPETVIDFGELPDAIDALLQRGVVAYRSSSTRGEAFFREALALAPRALPIYFCLYKTHTYRGDLTAALEVAEAGLGEAARQAGLSPDYRAWRFDPLLAEQTAGRFALYTLKALAFIRLKRDERDLALELLQHLSRLDPDNPVGWSVVSDLSAGVST
jgi:hypothetical protein